MVAESFPQASPLLLLLPLQKVPWWGWMPHGACWQLGAQLSPPRVHEGAERVNLNLPFSQFHWGSRRGCQSVRALFTAGSSNPYREHLFHQHWCLQLLELHQWLYRLHSCSSSPWSPGLVLLLLWRDTGRVNGVSGPTAVLSVSRAVSWDPAWCQRRRLGGTQPFLWDFIPH